jgi:hypothetical protein
MTLREFFSTHDHTTGCAARDVDGDATDPCHVSARSWCALGAIMRLKISLDRQMELAMACFEMSGRKADGISQLNDSPDGLNKVLAAADRIGI